MKHMARISFLFAVLFLTGRDARAAAPTMAEYTDNPIFMSNAVTPNVLIIQDNSGSMNDMAYPGSQANPTAAPYLPGTTYFGYFSSSRRYSFAANVFTIDAAGDWSGNFLNWACMRRIDISRKVLVGGKATSRTGGGNAQLIGDSGSGWWVWKFGPADNTGLSPAAYLNNATYQYTYELYNGYLYIYRYQPSTGGWTYMTRYNITVQKDAVLEPTEFVGGNLAGIMQKVKDKARWGIEFFNDGCGGGGEGCNPMRDGGNVAEPITGTGYGTNMITTIENTAANTWTPLAESLYTAAGYFGQNSAMRYNNGDYPILQTKDPLWYAEYNQYISCGKNYVIMITDGEPTMDNNIPATPPAPYASVNLRDFDNSGTDPAGAAGNSYTSDYLDDVALWAHTTDLNVAITNVPYKQTLTLYTVYAFGGSVTAQKLLNNAAKNGAFIDSNGTNTPDLLSEWSDKKDPVTGLPRYLSDGVTRRADTYYEATDGAALETELMAAITDILKRASSGTAVSVLATSATGAGNIYQAYFLPAKTIVDATSSRDIKWIGHLLSLKIDANGSLRDGSAANGGAGNCIKFRFDATLSETMVDTVDVSAAGVCGSTASATTPLSIFAGEVWDAGKLLSARAASNRTIFTFVDANKNGICDGCTSMITGESVAFTTASAATLQKHMGTASLAEAQNVISWIRGEAVAGYRVRTDENGNEWKLGDIIHSTPTVVSGAAEYYGQMYGDASHNAYGASALITGRASVVYIGANDGMLHAIDATTGSELWAYIPYNLLPHLRWQKDPNYTHVDYVDLKMKVTDINMGTGTGASANWKTILIGGMRFGGGELSDETFDVDADGDTPASKLRYRRSAYFALDITDPGSPKVMWEIGHNLAAYGLPDNALGFSMTYPAIAKVGDEWFAIVGTGAKSSYVPDYQGAVEQTARVFVINVKTGVIMANFAVSDDALAWFSDPVSVDIDFKTDNTVSGGAGGPTYNTDAIYIGETYWKSTGGGSWNGRVWRITTDPTPETGATPMNSDISPTAWKMYDFFNTATGQSISSAPSITTDSKGNLWVYFGTGKYYSQWDKSDTTNLQTLYGIKDPCWQGTPGGGGKWNAACATWGSKHSIVPLVDTGTTPSVSAVAAAPDGLVDVTDAVVRTDQTVTLAGAGLLTQDWPGLTQAIAGKSGWLKNLKADATASPVIPAGQRSLNKPSVVGGLVLFTSFIPDTSVCGLGGNSYFYAVYYETGTAYYTPVIGTKSGTTEVLSRAAGSSIGMASSIAVHQGRESGMKAYIQLSTGEAKSIDVEAATKNKSGIYAWREL